MSSSEQPSSTTSTMTTSKESISSSLKNDPLLSQFLAEDFSPTVYLNHTLQPSQQSSSSQTSSQQQQRTFTTSSAQNATTSGNSLSNLHSIASSLLSELDVHLNRLQTTLSGLTDDILRVTPRLGYEVEVLRSDIVTVAETLSGEEVERLMAQLEIPEPVLYDEDGEEVKGVTNGVDDDTADGDKTSRKAEKEDNKKAEESLQRLCMLVKVRDHLDEVIKIFGDAMEWTLSDSQRSSSATAAPTGLPSYAPPVTSTIPTAAGGNADASGDKAKVSGSEKLEQEINYLVSNNELEKASKRVEEISKLLAVWQNTSEYAVRSKFVDNLRWKVLEASKEEELAEDEAAGLHDVDDAMGGGVSSGGGRDGYYSLINQLQRMRGMG